MRTDPRTRLEALRRAGAPVFDRPGFRFIESLLQRAVELEGPARDRLERRAHQRLGALEEALRVARAEAAAALAAVRAAGADEDGAVAHRYARGDYRGAVREARRILAAIERHDGGATVDRLRRLYRRARAQTLSLPAGVAAEIDDLLTRPLPLPPAAEARARALGDDLARALFRDAAAHARAALVVARAADRLPDDVGPYNPQALAADTLALIESLSPAYLRTCLAGLEELAALRCLPEPPRRRRR